MNTYLVYRYRQENGAIAWTGSDWRGRIHDMAIYPVWQVQGRSLRETVKALKNEWQRRNPSCNGPPGMVQ